MHYLDKPPQHRAWGNQYANQEGQFSMSKRVQFRTSVDIATRTTRCDGEIPGA
jgi:hypothetical protein